MKLFLIAGEASGDALGAALIRALRRLAPETVVIGVGGAEMAREGLKSLFPIEDIAVMGLAPVLARLPKILARIGETTRAAVDARPDCLILIDAPDFTHRVARRVRRRLPGMPVVDYVSPTVWAWRPGRARAMRAYIDCVLALFPFEPAVYERLGGPPCVYVGHPLAESLATLARDAGAYDGPLLVLPGSRRSEITRLTGLYGAALGQLRRRRPLPEIVIPVAPHMEGPLADALADWPLTPQRIGPSEKFATFRKARAALVTSGAATLELALAGVPMAVAYRVSPPESLLRFLVSVDSIVLPNLILGENVVPEFFQERATPEALADALDAILDETPARQAQEAAFVEVRARIAAAGPSPARRAAEVVLGFARPTT